MNSNHLEMRGFDQPHPWLVLAPGGAWVNATTEVIEELNVHAGYIRHAMGQQARRHQ